MEALCCSDIDSIGEKKVDDVQQAHDPPKWRTGLTIINMSVTIVGFMYVAESMVLFYSGTNYIEALNVVQETRSWKNYFEHVKGEIIPFVRLLLSL